MKKTLILALVLVPVLAGCSLLDQDNQDTISPEEARAKAETFVNQYLIEGDQQTASITNVTEEEGLYQLDVSVGEEVIESYMTKNGKKFFASAIDMEDPTGAAGQPAQSGQSQAAPATPAEQAQSLISQSKSLLEQYGDNLNEQDKSELDNKVNELEGIVESGEPSQEDLQGKMQEVQEATQPLVDQIMEQQEEQQQQQPGAGVQPVPQE